eukprot:3397101-Rhodomonas_salina.3
MMIGLGSLTTSRAKALRLTPGPAASTRQTQLPFKAPLQLRSTRNPTLTSGRDAISEPPPHHDAQSASAQGIIVSWE